MPIYEFQCGKCQTVFTETMKMSDPHPAACPACGGTPVEKIMSLTSFQLKGSGWYADGYSGATKPAAKPASDGVAAAEAKPAASEGTAAPAAPAAAAKPTAAAPAAAPTKKDA